MRVGCIMRTRAAASSIASGIPSRRSAIWPIAAHASASGTKPGRACCARSTNSATAVDDSSDGTRHATSPATPIGSRLVASTRRRGHACSSDSIISAAGVEYLLAVVDDEQRVEIAQLLGQRVDERTTELLAQAEHAGHGLGRCRGRDRPRRALRTTRRRGERRARRPPRASASRVLPHPPVPVSVTKRCSRTASRTDAISASRPTKLETRGQVRRHRSERPQRRELVTEIGMHELPDPLGPSEVLQPMQSQIAQLGAVGKRVDHQIAGRVGDQRLAAVTDRAHARTG